MPWGAPSTTPLEALRRQAEDLGNMLDEIQRQIRELEAAATEKKAS
jgi:hypothetical protein